MPFTTAVTFSADPCPCCSTCDCGCCTGGYYMAFDLVATGISFVGTVPPCQQCEADRAADINGTYRLKKRAGCNWSTDERSGTQPDCDLPQDAPKWSLFCDGTYWYLVDDIHTSHLYRASTADFNCTDGGTFGLDPAFFSDGCVSYPSSMTLNPAGVFIAC